MFGVNMWFKIENFKFVMPVYYGCNVLDYDVILGVDFLQFIEAVQIHESQHQELLIFDYIKPKKKRYNFLHLIEDNLSQKYYYRPQQHTLVHIDKYYFNNETFAKKILCWDIWLKGAHYLSFKRSLSFSQIRAFMSLSTNTPFPHRAGSEGSGREKAEPGYPINTKNRLLSHDIWLYYRILENVRIERFQSKKIEKIEFASYPTESLITTEYMTQFHDKIVDYQNSWLESTYGGCPYPYQDWY
eukprot:UN03496